MVARHNDLIHDLLASLRGRGAQSAVIAFAEDGSADRLSYASLDGLIGRFAHGLRARGIGRGSPVAVLSENGRGAIVARLALLGIGAAAVSLDPDAPIEESRRELEISASELLLASRRFLDRAQGVAASALPILEIGALECEALGTEQAFSAAEFPPEDRAALFFTSGTTGPPKAVPLTRQNIAATIEALRRLDLVGTADCVLLPLPLHHSYPFIVGLLVTLASGATLVLPSALTGPSLAFALREAGVSVIVGVPRLYEALLQAIESQLRAKGALAARLFEAALKCSTFVRQLSGLRLGRLLFAAIRRRLGARLRIMASGGAHLDERVAARLESLGFAVLEGYGLVETASVSTFNPPGRARLGSVGLPAPGVEIRIDEPDREGQGEILIRGPNVFPGYLHDAEANARAFAPGGWFRSGDIGRRDRNGYLYVTGRLKEIIVLPDGKKIAPEELEAVYATSPLLREVALLETRDGLQALVVPDMRALRGTSASPEDAIRVALSEIGQTLPAYKRLSGFAVMREPLPRSHLGKYERRQLPALLEQAQRHARKPSLELTQEDQALLEDPLARALWNWLHERFAGQTFDLETSPQLELGIDSLGWIELSLAIQSRFNVQLPEETVPRILTLRDLLRAARDAPRAKPAEPQAGAVVEAEAWLAPPSLWRTAVASLMFGFVWLAARGLFHLNVRGAEKIPSSRPLIIAANHTSDLDPFFLAAALPFSLLKDSYWGGDAGRLFATAFRRWFAKTVHIFPVDDRAPGASLARALAILDRGKVLLWFPESWRSPNGALQRFLPGVGRLIREREACVVPAYIAGAFEALPRRARWPRLVPVSVTFGEAIPFSALQEKTPDRSDAHLADALRAEVATLAQTVARATTSNRATAGL